MTALVVVLIRETVLPPWFVTHTLDPSGTPIVEVAAMIDSAMSGLYSNTQHFMGNHECIIDGDRQSDVDGERGSARKAVPLFDFSGGRYWNRTSDPCRVKRRQRLRTLLTS